MRSMLPQSRKTMVRSATSAGGSFTASLNGMCWYSGGSGNSSAPMYITEFLPSSLSISWVPSSEPSASPSGFSCVTSRSLSA